MAKNKYGTVTVGSGSDRERTIPIKSFLTLNGIDGRSCTCTELENNEGYVLEIKNPDESVRSSQNLFVTEESLSLLMSTYMFFLNAKGMDLESLFKKSIGSNVTNYSSSDDISLDV